MNLSAIFFTLIAYVIGIAILFFVIKFAVASGIKAAYRDLNIYIKDNIKKSIEEAKKADLNE